MEVKNNHAHVTTQRILNKFIEINFSVGCMVWPWCCLFWPELPVMILMRWKISVKLHNLNFVIKWESIQILNHIEEENGSDIMIPRVLTSKGLKRIYWTKAIHAATMHTINFHEFSRVQINFYWVHFFTCLAMKHVLLQNSIIFELLRLWNNYIPFSMLRFWLSML